MGHTLLLPTSGAGRPLDRLAGWGWGSRAGSAPLGHHILPEPGPRETAHLPRRHSPILPLGFVDVTVSASANFAALVFKQVLDPLPLAAQLHFKVIVHCHGRRGRGAGVAAPRRGGGGPPGGSGSRGPREAARSTPGGRSAGPAAAAGARGGPARAPGTSSGAAGRGPAGVGWGDTRRGTRGRRRARDEGWGWGARSLPLSPRAPGLWLLRSGRALGPRGGRRRRGGLSLGRSRLAALTHAHARSLARSAVHSDRKAAPHNSRHLLRERRAGTRGTRPRCRKNVAKTRAAPLSPPPAPRTSPAEPHSPGGRVNPAR